MGLEKKIVKINLCVFSINFLEEANRKFIRNLLFFIKRTKSFINFDNDKTKTSVDTISNLKEEVDAMQRRASQIEDYLQILVSQNDKVLDDNKYLSIELIRAKFNN